MAPRLSFPFSCLLLLGVVGFSIAARPSPSPTGQRRYVLVLLGDSITDTGNTFRLAGVPDPLIYIGPNGTYPGRYTNGRNWVDYLNETLSKQFPLEIYNYAYGGAPACASPLMELFAPFIKNVTGQTQDFIADVKSGKIKVDANTQVLVIQWIGSNDYLLSLRDMFSSGSMPSQQDVQALVQTVTQCRIDNLKTLAALSGVVTDIVVLPISPIHLAPQLPDIFKPQAQMLEDVVGTATAAAVKALQKALDKLPPGAPGAGVEVHLVGATASWIGRGVGKVKPPFKYVDVPCFVNPNAPILITPNLTICADPAEYFFYDDSHPSSRFHEWFALKGLLPRLQNLRLLP